MSGTRIPDGAPEAKGLHQSKPGAIKPDAEGLKLLKATGGNIPPVAKNSSPVLKPEPVPTQSPIPSQNAVSVTASAREVFRQAAVNLGLPQDSLSAALLVFARYFSLPIKPALIGQLRREILNTGKTSSPETAAGKAALDSEAMAAVIASDKGVTLSPEALARYASFLLPPVKNDDEEEPNDREELPEPEELKAIIEEQEQKDDFLGLLNSIPGKNGQYWMVFPFSIKVRGTELNVFIRLLKKEYQYIGEGEDLIVDVSGPKRQWRCFLKKSFGISCQASIRADIRVYPECSPKGLLFLQKEAESFLGSFEIFDEILVRNGDKMPSWVEDLSEICLPSIDEDV